jgi:PsbP-like protein
MRRVFSMLFVFLAVSLPAIADEISLKDGSKIVGHMSALLPDKIEVETAYGKMQIKRSDIVTIRFSESAPGTAPDSSAAPKVDESLQGTQYVNRTSKFSLTLPAGWKINRSTVHLPTTLAGLSSQDDMRFLVVAQEEYTGSLESYEGIIEINVRKGLSNYEQILKSPITVDGKPGLLISYRGMSKDNNVPIQFLVAIIASGNTMTRVTAWCIEPLFHEMQPAFEKILTSYRSSGQTSLAAGPSSRP